MSGRLPVHHHEQLSDDATDDIDLRWSWISDKLKSGGYKSYWYGKGHTGYVRKHAHAHAHAGVPACCGACLPVQFNQAGRLW